MTIPYPPIEADSRTLIAAGYQVTKPEFKGGGVTSPRLQGSKANSPTLTLEYRYLNETNTLDILTAWNNSFSGFFELALPSQVACGITNTNLAERIVSASATGWRFAEKPRIENLSAKQHNVTVRLEGGFYTRQDFAAETPSGGGGGFDALSLSPVAWWDGSDSGTIATSGGAITNWDDKSGNGWHLSQAIPSQRPVYATAAINGLSAAQWPTGDNDDTMITVAETFEFKEVYAVVQYDGTSFSNYDGILGARDDSWYISGNASGTGMQVLSGTTIYLNAENTTNRSGNVFTEISSPCLLRVTSAITRSTTAGAAIGMDRYYTFLYRGWSGYIAEMLVFATQLSTDDREDVETYLMDKWGIV